MRFIGFLTMALIVAFSVTGCRGLRGGAETGPQTATNDLLTAALLDGDLPLGERTAYGQPVLGLTFEPVRFAYDSFRVEDSERGKVESVATYLGQHPSLTLVVEGHCDERGSREYNLSLGERRALAVREYLVRLGIATGRIQSLSYGEERPANPAHDELAWAANRRVEFAFYK